jgi:hypothetical protein
MLSKGYVVLNVTYYFCFSNHKYIVCKVEFWKTQKSNREKQQLQHHRCWRITADCLEPSTCGSLKEAQAQRTKGQDGV